MSSCYVKATLTNTKGIEFEVYGSVWSGGIIRIANPRPKKYPKFLFLYTEPDLYCKSDQKRLYWLRDEDAELGELSPFRLKSMLMAPKPVKRRGRSTGK